MGRWGIDIKVFIRATPIRKAYHSVPTGVLGNAIDAGVWLTDRTLPNKGTSTDGAQVCETTEEELRVKKERSSTEYKAVPELPMGQQMFRQMAMENVYIVCITMHTIVFLLSHSQYKYM